MAVTEPLEPLVEAAREGDSRAFDQLVRLTYGDVYSLARRMTGNDADAHDVVQDTYVRAFRAVRRFRGDSAFSTWLYRITSNCASTLLTRRSRQRCDDLSAVEQLIVDDDPDQDPTLRAEASTLRQTIERALEQLPARLRAVVVLKDVEDLSHREIAERLGISESATKVRLHRARHTLRRLLPNAFDDGSDAVVLDLHPEPAASGSDEQALGA